MLAETAMEWTEPWKQESLQKGRRDGRQEGLLAGEAIVLAASTDPTLWLAAGRCAHSHQYRHCGSARALGKCHPGCAYTGLSITPCSKSASPIA